MLLVELFITFKLYSTVNPAAFFVQLELGLKQRKNLEKVNWGLTNSGVKPSTRLKLVCRNRPCYPNRLVENKEEYIEMLLL